MSKKHIIFFILLTIPLFVSAYDCQVDGIYYNLKFGNEAEVTSGDTKYSGAVSIPQKFTYNNVDYSVTSIGDYAFNGCSSLTSVTIPNSVTTIGSYAFTGCSGLTSISIPNSVVAIGKQAFAGCDGLKKVIVEDIAAWCAISFGDATSNPLNYARHLYSDENTEIKDLVIPNSVTTIGDYAFYWCYDLTSVTIPNSVTSIGNDAFGDCQGLTSITIPNSVTSIGDGAFFWCTSLTSVTIPNSVTSIGRSAFSYCESLIFVTIPNSVTSIGDYAFNSCKSLKEIYCFITNPMPIDSNTFSSYTYSQAILKVPYGKIGDFYRKNHWGDFKRIVETVSEEPVAIIAMNDTIAYGDALPTFGYSTIGSTLQGTPEITCSATSSSDVGRYEIVVSKGNVSNNNVICVNGILRIKQAELTASVGEYTRKPNEDNPEFTINYTGFKNDQTKSVLIKEPVAVCEATKDSPSGTYPITLSGGQARNYEFKYEDGVLNVLYSYTLSIMSVGNGTTVLGAQAASQNNSFNTTVYSGELYTVFFKPDQGYKLEKLLWNDKDVTSEVTNNTYKISNVSETSTLVAMYVESLEEFTSGDITYEILSGSDRTVAVTKGNYTGQIEIPATVSYKDIQWNVVGIKDFAFSNTTILTVVVPESVIESNIGGGVFSGCQNLAAITWNANFAITGNVLSGLSNPNLLFYIKNAAYAPSSVKNVVVNGTAEEITLTDAEGCNNFYCPTEFTARKISYTHNYKMTSGFGGKAQGWETIALPFDVKEIKHSSKGTVLPFAAWNNSASAKPFWLYGLSASGFSRASSIQANTPYVICMPNNEEYDTDYILSGSVTFSATNAKVNVSSAVNNGKSGSKTFIPAFCAQEKSDGIYALNVYNDLHNERGGYDEGSRFVSNLRAVSPFEAYMTDSSTGAKQTIDIEFSDATGIEELTGNGENQTTVYTIMGQKVKDERLKTGTLPQGIYIKNGRKVSIKK